MLSNRRGFTLIEILAAMFIFSVIITSLFGSFRVLTSSSSILGNGSLQYEMAQGCLTRITTDIESIYVAFPPFYEQPEMLKPPDSYRILGDSSYTEGNSFSTLRFTSLAHISFSRQHTRNGVAEIIYYVSALDNGELVLRRSDRLYPYGDFEEKATDPIVCRKVIDFTVTYFDGDGKDTDSWDSDSYEFNFSTPRSMGILLKVGDEDAPTIFSTRIYIPAYREKKV